MRTLLLFCITGVLLAQTPPQKQADPPPDVISVNVDVVSVLASVHDKKGGLISNLEKSDFTVLEDGKEQTIKYFTKETDLPLTIGLLVDVSGSQRNLIDVEHQAASQFFQQVVQKKDQAFVMSFGSDSELLQDYTNSSRLLNDGLSRLRVHSGVSGIHPGPVPNQDPKGTVLYDAVFLAADEKLKKEVGRKVIVVITDGVDQGSQMTLNQAVEAAQKADAVIYSVEYFDASAYGGGGLMLGGGGGGGVLKKMSEETGGRAFRVSRGTTLQQIFKEISDEMRSQYAIGFVSTNPSKTGYRKLDVKVASKDLKVQARKGYYASADRD